MPTKQVGRSVPFEEPKARYSQDAVGIKEALCDLLDQIESGGSIVTAGVYPEAPLPDLFLRGYGPVPLPLAQRDADAICKERKEGIEENVPQMEKSVDKISGKHGKHLHNQWETGKDNLEIRNRAWNKFVRKIAVKAGQDLCIKLNAGPVKAEMHKLRLWAAGACLPPYKDLSNKAGCFGKLLVCLPAAHQGGKLLATYEGQTKEFLTETSSLWGYSYVAWYGDVTLEFKPLDSGYRVMLEYDLIVPSSAKLTSLARVYSEKRKLRDFLAAWNDKVEKDKATRRSSFPTLLAYICDFHYTSEPLSLDVLQGNDRLRAACLQDLCSQIGMGLYIADLDRTHSGVCEYYHGNQYDDNDDDHHEITIEDTDEITLSNMAEVNGKTAASDICLEEDENFIQCEPFGDDPDDEDYQSYHGLVTHYYRKTVLVMIPSVAKSEWLPEETKQSRPNKRKRSVEVINLE